MKFSSSQSWKKPSFDFISIYFFPLVAKFLKEKIFFLACKSLINPFLQDVTLCYFTQIYFGRLLRLPFYQMQFTNVYFPLLDLSTILYTVECFYSYKHFIHLLFRTPTSLELSTSSFPEEVHFFSVSSSECLSIEIFLVQFWTTFSYLFI